MVIESGGGLIVSAKLRLTLTETLSVTVAVKLKFPAAEGVPVIEPAVERDRPAGAEPDHRYGGVPPEAASDPEYGTPTVPLCRGEVVVITRGGGDIEMLKARLSRRLSSSVTAIEKLKEPATLGVPVIEPALLNESPVGNAPEAIEKVYGGLPSLALAVPEYATPVVPVAGMEPDCIIRGAAISAASEKIDEIANRKEVFIAR